MIDFNEYDPRYLICPKCGANLTTKGITEILEGALVETKIDFKGDVKLHNTEASDQTDSYVRCNNCNKYLHDRTAIDIIETYKHILKTKSQATTV